MPKLDDNMITTTTANNYHFTAADIPSLGSGEYTLVSVVCDVSSSVHHYKKALIDCIKTVVASCQKSPRCDNLMIRLCTFNHELNEVHGFKELRNIKTEDYNKAVKPSGCTALYEAAFECVDVTARYGKVLADNDFQVNAIVFVITDGEGNSSRRNPDHIHQLLARLRKNEEMSLLTTVLVGVTAQGHVSQYLSTFQQNAGLDHYIDLGDATSDKLAGLAGFMSRSICMTSQVLSSGGMAPVIPLRF